MRTKQTFGKWGTGAPRRLHESAFKLAHRLNRHPLVCDECGSAEVRTVANWRCCDDCGEPAKAHVCVCGSRSIHRRRVFSLSLGDWLDPEVPVEWLARMLDTIRQCDQATWILCTKRPEYFQRRLFMAWPLCGSDTANWVQAWANGTPPKNICVLTSIENQEAADERIPHMLRIPARWRGLSCEPLLGPLSLLDVGTGYPLAGLDWLIIGGESGPKARPCNVGWVRSLVEQGKAAGVATFVKQIHGADGKLLKDMADFPDDLRIQQWPEGL